MFLIIRSRRRRARVRGVLGSVLGAAPRGPRPRGRSTAPHGDGVPRAATPPPRGTKDLHVSLAVAARADKNPKKRADPSGTALYSTEVSLVVPIEWGNKS